MTLWNKLQFLFSYFAVNAVNKRSAAIRTGKKSNQW